MMSLKVCNIINSDDFKLLKGSPLVEIMLRNQFQLDLNKSIMTGSEVYDWINENCKKLVYCGEGRGSNKFILRFEDKEEAVLFKLALK
jgi:hypothetical protein